MRKLSALAVVVLLALAACGESTPATGLDPSPSAPTEVPSAIETAQANCEQQVAVGNSWAMQPPGELLDGGEAISLSSDFGEDTIDGIVCIFAELDLPDSIIARMDRTRALDGMQEAQWPGFAASWTYHPDDGLNVIITEEEGD